MSTGHIETGKEPAGNGNAISLSNLVPKDHKLYHIFNFIGENYGSSPENILRAIGSIFDFDKGLRTLLRSKFSLKNFMNLLRYTLPASFYGLELGIKIKKYIKDLYKDELSEYDKYQIKLHQLLDIEKEDKSANIEKWRASYLNEDILDWLLKKPKTDGFKILGYYNDAGAEKYEKLPAQLESMFILIEFHEKKILLHIDIRTFGSLTFLESMTFLGQYPLVSQEVIKELEMKILKNFILTFNIKENILEFKGSIVTKRRTVVEEKINQFNVKPLIKEIKKVLKHRRKRGYAFIGKQGTGKSIIMRKIEEVLVNNIVIRIGPDEFSSSGGIKRCFNLIRTVQPAVVIIEDLDAFRFKEKNERVGTFLKEIDDNSLNAVFLITVNDPEMIHKTIIDRPGRFDEIYQIKPPQTPKEAYEVMKSKYDMLVDYYTDFKNIQFPKIRKFNGILQRCLDNKFTQAELTSGIVEKVFLNTEKPKEIDFNDVIQQAIESFEVSKKSLQTYKFNEEEIMDDDVMPDECAKEERAEPTVLTTGGR